MLSTAVSQWQCTQKAVRWQADTNQTEVIKPDQGHLSILKWQVNLQLL